jgi:protein SCO1/2
MRTISTIRGGLALAGVTAAAAVLVTTACSRVQFHARVHQPPRPIPAELALRDQHERPFRFAQYRGDVVLVNFGYTRCPDVCPLVLGTFRSIQEALGPDGRRVRFVFITIDPEQDTRDVLRRYLRLFSDEFIGISGAPAELQPLYDAFGVRFEKVADPNTKSRVKYLMAHSTNTAVLDRRGLWRLDFKHDTKVPDAVSDIRQLLRR